MQMKMLLCVRAIGSYPNGEQRCPDGGPTRLNNKKVDTHILVGDGMMVRMPSISPQLTRQRLGRMELSHPRLLPFPNWCNFRRRIRY